MDDATSNLATCSQHPPWRQATAGDWSRARTGRGGTCDSRRCARWRARSGSYASAGSSSTRSSSLPSRATSATRTSARAPTPTRRPTARAGRSRACARALVRTSRSSLVTRRSSLVACRLSLVARRSTTSKNVDARRLVPTLTHSAPHRPRRRRRSGGSYSLWFAVQAGFGVGWSAGFQHAGIEYFTTLHCLVGDGFVLSALEVRGAVSSPHHRVSFSFVTSPSTPGPRRCIVLAPSMRSRS